MTNTETIKFHAELLFKKFGKITLTTLEVVEVIGRSKVSLERDRAQKKGIPYSQFGKEKGAGRNVVHYTVTDIAKFMIDNQLKVTA